MAEYVSVSIPETLYRRAHELARARRQPTDAIIKEALEQLLTTRQLVDAAVPPVADETAMAYEIAAYEAMHSGLMAAYLGEYVAVLGGKLVDHDADETTLLRRVESQYPDRVVLLKRVLPMPEPELRIRSPKLERDRQ